MSITRVDAVLKIAVSQLGVHEIAGSNSGPEVDQYLAAVGLGPGAQWCSAYCFYCLKKAGVVLPDLPANPAWVPDVESWGRRHGILHVTPERGDLMLLCDAQGPFHIGIVESVGDGYRVNTIEGNTSGEGSGGSDANGGGVHRRTRAISQCEFVRWADLVEGDAAPPPAKPLAYLEVWDHDGKRSVKFGGKVYTVTGVKINGKPFEGGTITVAYRPE